jgi:ribose-phosphate pyrophosphokinase
MSKRGELAVLACASGKPFALKVLAQIKGIVQQERVDEQVRFIESKETHFANTEIKTEIEDSIRGTDLFIFQDVENSVNGYSVDENLRALKTALDAAWRSGAGHISLIIPSFPYARQDKSKSREGITAARVAEEIESHKATQILTLDIHNSAIAGFFRMARFEGLHASKNIMDYIATNIDTNNMVVLAPDAGGASRAEHYASRLKTNLGFIYKKRDYSKSNAVSESILLGTVRGKDVLLVDDMVDTGGTVVSSVKLLKEKEGAKKVYFACALPLFNGEAVKKLDALCKKEHLTGFIGTDAVYHGENFAKRYPWFIEVSVAKYFARVIFNINHNRSISELLKK